MSFKSILTIDSSVETRCTTYCILVKFTDVRDYVFMFYFKWGGQVLKDILNQRHPTKYNLKGWMLRTGQGTGQYRVSLIS